MMYNGMMGCHFRGRQLLGEVPDPYHHSVLRAYYIDSDDYVGLSDGNDAWIGPVNNCMHALKLPQRIQNLKAGILPIVEQCESRERRRIVLDEVQHTPTQITRRRVHVS